MFLPFLLKQKQISKSFWGFPLVKMIKGFMRVSKEMKRINST